VTDDRTAERRVAVGRREKERVEILEGLEPGESVLIAPAKLREEEPRPAR
jgi:multidrug efflux pump subunit AcrA (membrane-fusion protein)